MPDWDYVAAPLGRPWWEWAITDKLKAVVARRDRPQPSRECPWCLARVSFASGRFAQHREEGKTHCRASGLSHTVATRVLQGTIEGRPVGWLLEPFGPQQISPTAPPPRDPVGEARQIMARLCSARLNAGLSRTAVAERVGTSSIYIRDWEEGVRGVELPSMMRVAGALDVQVVVTAARIGDVTVKVPADVRQALQSEREMCGTSIYETARTIGIKTETLRHRERIKSTMAIPLEDVCAWTAAVGAKLQVLEGVKDALRTP